MVRLFFLSCFFVIAGVVYGSDDVSFSAKEQLKTWRVFGYLSQFHFSKQSIDDQYSKSVFDHFIKKVDPGRRIFLVDEVESLRKYQFLIDDELKTRQLSFYKEAYSVVEERVSLIESWTDEILSTPFDFSIKESLELDPEKREYASTFEELKVLWRKLLKYQSLMNYILLYESKVSSNVTGNIEKVVELDLDAELEVESREKVVKSMDTFFESIRSDTDDDRLAVYLDAAAQVFDPHSSYFLPEKKEDFDIGITGTLEGIGAVLREEDGFIKVVRIVIGSASWRQGELKAEDKILKVQEGSGGELVDIVGVKVGDAVKLIRGKKGTEVRLTVKQSDGQIKVIPIVRDVVVIEETYAKGAVIKNEKVGKSFGYIKLPKFYTDFRHQGSRNSSDDVAKEVSWLMSEGVSGIVLDFRGNGGGSLRDAVKMAGLFIDRGPIVQIKDRKGSGQVLEDPDGGVLYDGPLVVLLDGSSASASEIVAAALQDYGRAVIVGGSQTFGKGTVQTFADLDQRLPLTYFAYKPLGSLKLTIQKFYRVTGGSTQFKGVVPDVILPDTYDYSEYGERNYDYALPWDTVEPLSFEFWDGASHVSRLKRRSGRRVAKSKVFKKIQDNYDRLAVQRDDTTALLELQGAWDKKKRLKMAAEPFSDLSGSYDYLKVFAKPLAKDAGKAEKEKYKSIEEWVVSVSKDPYINESTFILSDIDKYER